MGSLILRKSSGIKSIAGKIAVFQKERIQRGIENTEGAVFLHTGPHHDDIMLGYLPYIVHLVRSPKNRHYFATLTSGFTSVTNAYMLAFLKNLEGYIGKGTFNSLLKEKYFAPENLTGRNRDMYQYLDGVAAGSLEMQREAEARRMLRNMVDLVKTDNGAAIKKHVGIFINYFLSGYPGKKDSPEVQKLKGMIREWEEELLWGHLGFNCDSIFHLRLGFYTGDIFNPEPEWKRDVVPIINLLKKTEPDFITVTLDPEGSGPDTHYKALQAVAEAVNSFRRRSGKKMKVWGYRNVWYRFHPSEANIYVPVSMNSLAIMKGAFQTCFGSQRSASFPSYEYDGPFCDLAQKIMVEQFGIVKACLGRDFFYSNPVPRIRASRGLNFIREMDCEEFLKEAVRLRKLTEST